MITMASQAGKWKNWKVGERDLPRRASAIVSMAEQHIVPDLHPE
jgi:hypothetical protein